MTERPLTNAKRAVANSTGELALQTEQIDLEVRALGKQRSVVDAVVKEKKARALECQEALWRVQRVLTRTERRLRASRNRLQRIARRRARWAKVLAWWERIKRLGLGQ